jgi:RNA polymerase sigma-70 factor (ECF subfamily)
MDDAELLASGDHVRLLARYEPVIVARCVAALRGSLDAEDVAQDVKLRLWRELRAGKRYPVPFRVVVHKVVDWTLREHWAGRDTALPLPEGWEPSVEDDPLGPLVVQELLEELPAREREVWELLVREGLGHEQIAVRLGIERNNVDQALARGRRKLREKLAGG